MGEECVCAQSFSCARLFATPWTVAHEAPLSMGILQARILDWVAMPSSRGSGDPTNVSWSAPVLPRSGPVCGDYQAAQAQAVVLKAE